MHVVLSHDIQVVGVVLVVHGGWVSVFVGYFGGGHPLSLIVGSDFGGGDVLGVEFILVPGAPSRCN